MLFENPVRVVSKKLKIVANSKWYVSDPVFNVFFPVDRIQRPTTIRSS